jgi:hypothetical protein
MVGRLVSTRLFAGVVFSSIQLLILVVGFTYQADAEARCRGGGCRVQRFAPFNGFKAFNPCVAVVAVAASEWCRPAALGVAGS